MKKDNEEDLDWMAWASDGESIYRSPPPPRPKPDPKKKRYPFRVNGYGDSGRGFRHQQGFKD